MRRYHSIGVLLRQRFGERVCKIALQNGCGCPNRDGTAGWAGCAFCSLEALRPCTGREGPAAVRPIGEQIEEGLAYLQERHGAVRAIGHFGNGSATYAPAGSLRAPFFGAASHPAIVGLAISTRPDCIASEHVELLRELSGQTFLWVELGLQSAHDRTLRRIGRGHGVEHFREAHERLCAAGISVCAHVILGLPGEAREEMLQTVDFLNALKVWGVKFHNLHILKGTPLEELHRQGEVQLPAMELYASWVADAIERLEPSILIHRFTGHSPRRLTVAPEWSVNKLAVMNAVEAELQRRDAWQGKALGCGRPQA